MKKVLFLSMLLSVAPVALAQDTSTNTTTTDTTTTTPLDPNGDGVVDTNNNGRADTREFPWGLLGLLGLAGLAGLNRRTVTATPVRVDTNRT